MTWRVVVLSCAEIWIFWAQRYDLWQTLAWLSGWPTGSGVWVLKLEVPVLWPVNGRSGRLPCDWWRSAIRGMCHRRYCASEDRTCSGKAEQFNCTVKICRTMCQTKHFDEPREVMISDDLFDRFVCENFWIFHLHSQLPEGHGEMFPQI